MRKSLLLAAIVLLAGSSAWAQTIGTAWTGATGSNGANNVDVGVASGKYVSPANAPTRSIGTAWSGSAGSNGVDNANAGAAAVAAPSATATTTGTTSAAQPSSTMAMQTDMNFNPSNYKTQTDCLNAAAAAHASLNACKGVKK